MEVIRLVEINIDVENIVKRDLAERFGIRENDVDIQVANIEQLKIKYTLKIEVRDLQIVAD